MWKKSIVFSYLFLIKTLFLFFLFVESKIWNEIILQNNEIKKLFQKNEKNDLKKIVFFYNKLNIKEMSDKEERVKCLENSTKYEREVIFRHQFNKIQLLTLKVCPQIWNRIHEIKL